MWTISDGTKISSFFAGVFLISNNWIAVLLSVAWLIGDIIILNDQSSKK